MVDVPDGSRAERRARRAWVGWLVVGLAAVGVGLSFMKGEDDKREERRGSGPRPTAVAAEVVTRGDVVERVRYPGELDADAADVASFFGGRVAEVKVRVGDAVTAGEVLARLDPVDLSEQLAQARAQVAAAQAEARRAQVEVAQARRELARLEALGKDALVATREVEDMRATLEGRRMGVGTAEAQAGEAKARVALLERRLAESEVRAPFSGRVAERYVDPGGVVSAGARLVRVVAERPLWLRFEVPEHEVPLVAEGASVEVTMRGGGRAEATVSGLAGEVSRDRRVAVAEARLEAPPERWLAGMYAEANVAIRKIERGLVVPGRALVSRLAGEALVTGVFVEDDGHARWVEVDVLGRDGERVAVAARVREVDVEAQSGAKRLVEGARVLTMGHVDLVDGAAVKLAEPARAEAR